MRRDYSSLNRLRAEGSGLRAQGSGHGVQAKRQKIKV